MLSIIITHYKTPILLKLCLKSIYQNIEDLKHEILIVDGESNSETRQMILNEFSQVKFISFTENVGYAKMTNQGIKQTKGDYILILNADILILEKSLQKMLNYLTENAKIGLIGPKLLTFSNQAQKSCFAFPSIGAFLARRTFLGKFKWGKEKLNNFLLKNKDYSRPVQVDWIQGSAMMTTKSAIQKIGLLDERFFMYLEDTDWCRRFWKNGFKVIYFPEANMSHYYYRISKKWGGVLDLFFNKYTRIHTLSALKYFWKYRYN